MSERSEIGSSGPPAPHPGDAAAETVLQVRDLEVSFRIGGAWRAATRGVSFDLRRNETLALVGESGCGKSITCQSLMGLIREPVGRVSGSVRYLGRELVGLSESALEPLRGKEIAMIFQEPMTALNPVHRVGDQVAEMLLTHEDIAPEAAKERAVALFEQVHIPAARRRYRDYPHQFSGGMRQRVMIAMAMACRPQVLLADEPTTALDVTIQAQVLAQLRELRADYGLAMVFITHSLGVVAAVADRVAVMYAGEIVELAPVDRLFDDPKHPYTRALLASIPSVEDRLDSLEAIPGQVPSIADFPAACRFAARCPHRAPLCERAAPPAVPLSDRGEPQGDEHQVRCWLHHPDPPAGGPQ